MASATGTAVGAQRGAVQDFIANERVQEIEQGRYHHSPCLTRSAWLADLVENLEQHVFAMHMKPMPLRARGGDITGLNAAIAVFHRCAEGSFNMRASIV